MVLAGTNVDTQTVKLQSRELKGTVVVPERGTAKVEGALVMSTEHGTHVGIGEVIGQFHARMLCDTALDMASHMVHKEDMGK